MLIKSERSEPGSQLLFHANTEDDSSGRPPNAAKADNATTTFQQLNRIDALGELRLERVGANGQMEPTYRRKPIVQLAVSAAPQPQQQRQRRGRQRSPEPQRRAPRRPHKQTKSLILAAAQNYRPSGESLAASYLTPKKTYPNNTLIEDLSKCHEDIAHFCPSASRATTCAAGLIKRCWSPLAHEGSAARAKGARLDSIGIHSVAGPRDERRPEPAGEHPCPAGLATSGDSTTRGRRRPISYQMPESVARVNSTLNADDYDRAISVLNSDIRFKLHLLLYRRVQTLWTMFSTLLCILVPVLFTNLEALALAEACLGWLGLQLLGLAATAQLRKKLDHMLENSVAQVNSFFSDHNLMIGVINAGSMLTKARLLIPILYFDTSQCREHIESIVRNDSRARLDGTTDKRLLDYSKIGLPLSESNDVLTLAQSQLAKKIVLRYSQRWISHFDRRKLMFADDGIKPRHLSTGKCLCQFIEEHFRNNAHHESGTGNNGDDKSKPARVCAPKAIKVNHSRLASKQRRPEDGQRLSPTNEYVAIQIGPTGDAPTQPAGEPQVGSKLLRNLAQAVPTLSQLVQGKHNEAKSASSTDSLATSSCEQIHDAGDHSADDKSGTRQNSRTLNNDDADDLQIAHRSEVTKPPSCASSSTNNNNKCASTDSSTTRPPSSDLFVELDNELMSEDELIRKLRFLLEMRKSPNGTLDGGQLCKQQDHLDANGRLQSGHLLSNQLRNANSSQREKQEQQHPRGGKARPFGQVGDGLFAVSPRKSQASHHHQANNMKQIVEIC